MNLKSIKHAIRGIKRSIECYLDIEKIDIETIEPMRYSDGVEPTKVPPLVQPGHKDGSRLKYRR